MTLKDEVIIAISRNVIDFLIQDIPDVVQDGTDEEREWLELYIKLEEELIQKFRTIIGKHGGTN